MFSITARTISKIYRSHVKLSYKMQCHLIDTDTDIGKICEVIAADIVDGQICSTRTQQGYDVFRGRKHWEVKFRRGVLKGKYLNRESCTISGLKNKHGADLIAFYASYKDSCLYIIIVPYNVWNKRSISHGNTLQITNSSLKSDNEDHSINWWRKYIHQVVDA